MANYHSVLQRGLKAAREIAARYPSGATKDQLLAEIERLTETLKGPLSNEERILLATDRAELREWIKLMEGH